MSHFPVLSAIRAPPDQFRAPQFPRWVTNLPEWGDRVKTIFQDIKGQDGLSTALKSTLSTQPSGICATPRRLSRRRRWR
eukprot:15312425-Alexandrium_andersonii.AAC.1